MTNVERFIEDWKKAKNIDAFLETASDLPDTKSIHIYLEGLRPEARKAIEQKLEAIMGALEAYTKETKVSLEDTRKQMKDSEEISKACASYEQADKAGSD